MTSSSGNERDRRLQHDVTEQIERLSLEPSSARSNNSSEESSGILPGASSRHPITNFYANSEYGRARGETNCSSGSGNGCNEKGLRNGNTSGQRFSGTKDQFANENKQDDKATTLQTKVSESLPSTSKDKYQPDSDNNGASSNNNGADRNGEFSSSMESCMAKCSLNCNSDQFQDTAQSDQMSSPRRNRQTETCNGVQQANSTSSTSGYQNGVRNGNGGYHNRNSRSPKKSPIKSLQPSGVFGRPITKSTSFKENMALADAERKGEMRKSNGISNTDILEQHEFQNHPSNRTTNTKVSAHEILEDSTHNYFVSFITLAANDPRQISQMYKWPLRIPSWVYIIGILPPCCLLIQTKAHQDKIQQTSNELAQTLCRVSRNPLEDSNKTRVEEQLRRGIYVAVYLESKMFRGQVEELLTSGCKVRLVDVGKLIFIKNLSDVYVLPDEFQDFNRQLGTVNILGLTAKDRAKDWKGFLEIIFQENDQVQVTIAPYEEEAAGFNFHYVGQVKLPNGKSLSDLLIEQNLAELNTVKEKDELKKLSQNTNYTKRKFIRNDNEEMKVAITSVVSPTQFYVRNECDTDTEILESMMLKKTFLESKRSYRTSALKGIRMCLVPYNSLLYARGFCLEFDFRKAIPTAKVLLIDCGTIKDFDLKSLVEYIETARPALTYHCELAVNPIGPTGDQFITKRLESIMQFNQKGEFLKLRCVDEKDGINRVILEFNYLEKPWMVSLLDAGYATTTIDGLLHKQILPLGVVTVPSTSDFESFLSTPFIGQFKLPTDLWTGQLGQFYADLESAKCLVPNSKVFLRRAKGMHTFLLMDEESHNNYLKLKSHCTKKAAEVCERHPFEKIGPGDVILAPLTPKKYQRAFIIEEKSIHGIPYAHVYFIDVHKFGVCKMCEIRPGTNYCISMPLLSHLVWLEGSEDALVFSKQFDQFQSDFKYCFTLDSFETVQRENLKKYVVRLSVREVDGTAKLLSTVIREMQIWDWARKYDLGFFTFMELYKEMYETPFHFSLNDFYKGAEIYIKEMCHKMVDCHVKSARWMHVTQQESPILLLSVVPHMDTAILNKTLLNKQMTTFYDKVGCSEFMKNSPTFPKMIALKDYDCLDIQSPLNCIWHRCIKLGNRFQCVDCFKSFNLERDETINNFQDRGITVKEIFPEMLKVPPIGLQLQINLPSGCPDHIKHQIELYINDKKTNTIPVEAMILKLKDCGRWDDEKNESKPLLAVIPQLEKEIKSWIGRAAVNLI